MAPALHFHPDKPWLVSCALYHIHKMSHHMNTNVWGERQGETRLGVPLLY